MAHHFFAYMNRMKYIRRWGLMRNTQVENDMEHAFQTAMIAHAIAEVEGMETVTDEEYKAQVKYWVDYYYGYMSEADIIQNMGETYLKEAAFYQGDSNVLLLAPEEKKSYIQLRHK